MTQMAVYSKSEWALVHEIMNYIESKLPSLQTASDVDVAKVKALVVRTYQAQDMHVTADMVDQVFKAMAHRGLPVTTNESHKALAERPDGPMARARAAVKRVQAHYPMTTVGLLEHVQTPMRRAKAAQKKILRVFTTALIGIPVVAASIIAFYWGQLEGMGLVGSIAGSFLLWVITLIQIATRDTSLGIDKMKALEADTTTAMSLLESDTDPKGYRQVSQLLQESLGVAYAYAPLHDDSPQWEAAHQAAAEDGTLCQAWTAWLQSGAPIREGDVTLLIEAAQAIRVARDVMATYAPTHGTEHQAKGRAKALERLQGEAG